MTDLGKLLGSTEASIERVHDGARPAAGPLARTVRRVRRRRAVRHAGQSVAGLALVGAAGTVVWLGGRDADGPAPAVTPTVTQAPTPAPTSTSTASTETIGPFATPLPVEPGLFESTTRDWMLTTSLDTDPTKPVTDLTSTRLRLELVGPDATPHQILEFDDRTWISVHSWRAGQPIALASVSVHDEADTLGWLDLRTGVLTPIEGVNAASGLVGTTDDGTVWLSPPPVPADLLSSTGGRPMPYRLLTDSQEGEILGTDTTLTVRDTDGTVRDLGPLHVGPYGVSLSPDGRWVTGTSATGAMVVVDVRTGTSTPVTSLPADRTCTVPGWSGPSTILLSCASADGTSYDLLGVDAARPTRPAVPVGTSEYPLTYATVLDDGRTGVTFATQEGPCALGGDPAILQDGAVVPLTGQWGRYDHGYLAQFSGTGVVTQLNACYDGTGKAGRERTVRTDLATGAITELGGPGPVETALPDGWIRSPSYFLPPS